MRACSERRRGCTFDRSLLYNINRSFLYNKRPRRRGCTFSTLDYQSFIIDGTHYWVCTKLWSLHNLTVIFKQRMLGGHAIGLFCTISSLLQGSFAKETYHFKAPTHRSHRGCSWWRRSGVSRLIIDGTHYIVWSLMAHTMECALNYGVYTKWLSNLSSVCSEVHRGCTWWRR